MKKPALFIKKCGFSFKNSLFSIDKDPDLRQDDNKKSFDSISQMT